MHYDAMQNIEPPESDATTMIKLEVFRLINISLDDEGMRTHDRTIMAVLQLMTSQIVLGKEQDLLCHEWGIWMMVQLRGALENLGINGQLAILLTM